VACRLWGHKIRISTHKFPGVAKITAGPTEIGHISGGVQDSTKLHGTVNATPRHRNNSVNGRVCDMNRGGMNGEIDDGLLAVAVAAGKQQR